VNINGTFVKDHRFIGGLSDPEKQRLRGICRFLHMQKCVGEIKLTFCHGNDLFTTYMLDATADKLSEHSFRQAARELCKIEVSLDSPKFNEQILDSLREVCLLEFMRAG
jgi:hypothetical protein